MKIETFESSSDLDNHLFEYFDQAPASAIPTPAAPEITVVTKLQSKDARMLQIRQKSPGVLVVQNLVVSNSDLDRLIAQAPVTE